MAEDSESQDQPRGEMQTRTLAMPADANPSGDIFGGWVLAQMDIAGGIAAAQIAKGRVATVAVTAMTFHLPVLVGDVLCVYASEPRVGRTSITLNLEAWALRRQSGQRVKVTQGEFVFVALDESGQPRAVTEEQSA
ncbi:MAG: acyl-CoA thioesterase [Kiloniellales bacterium]|nr:acyl-CoA thioesterase [Kiloniellales bacterium]MDJ0980876.1 acyl-CoA thioesterase [Kiloniellales bacterium]